MNIIIPTNEFQTPVTDELLQKYPEEVQEQFMDFMENVEFLKWLASPDRPRAKDLPRDSSGKIIVNLEKPHILEDMDYFRQPALHFLEHKCYTFLKPNSNPNSEYRKFWDSEWDKILNGCVRPSDGEWITGMCYWFLNYNPMMINKQVGKSRMAVRVEEFPLSWEGIYWRFHYLDQARKSGRNGIELAKRGVAKAHPYDTVVYTPEGKKLWGDIKVGDTLFDDRGGTTTVVDIPFDDECDIYELTFSDGRKVQASGEHLWDVEIHNHKNVETLSTLELLSIYRRTRKKSDHCLKGIEHICSISKNEGVDWEYQPTKVDPYTFGLLLGDGCFRHKSCYFTQLESDLEEERQFIPYNIIKWKGKHAYRIDIPDWSSILKSYGLYWVKSEDKFIPDEYKFNNREVRLNILKGLMDSDGFLLQDRNKYQITLSSKRLIEDIQFICRSLGFNCSYTMKRTGYKINGVKKECLPSYCLTIHTRDIITNLVRKQRRRVIVANETTIARELRTRIVDIKYIGKKQAKCVTVDNESHRYLIGDFIVTHNSYSLSSIMTHNLIMGENEQVRKRNITVLAAASKEYLKEDRDGTLSKFVPSLSFIFNNTPFPHLLRKKSPNEMSWVMGYDDANGIPQGSGNTVLAVSTKDDSDKLRGKRGWILIEEMGNYPNLLPLYDSVRRSTMEGDVSFSLIFLVGTANNEEADFTAAKTLLYSPDGYNILSLKNVYDKKNQGKQRFGFFFPAYVNRFGCYNKDGVSDVVKALLQILMDRYDKKYSADPQSVLRVIAEDPITPAEAIIKVKANYFPVAALTERAMQLDADPHAYDGSYTGNLVLGEDGVVKFNMTGETPLRSWEVKGDSKGCIEIFQMPEKNPQGEVFPNRYILGHDPVDNDEAESSSLSSTFVLDLFTDRIVAEYTGRHKYAEENYEVVRLLCMFYNAKCLYEAHPYDQIVRMPDGTTKLWGDIKIGDTLFAPNGNTVKVVDIPVDGESDIYRVTLADGRTIEASDNHIWAAYTYTNRHSTQEFTTKQMFDMGTVNRHGQHMFFLPESGAVDYPKREVPIDPYTMGLLIAEGAFTKFKLTKLKDKTRRAVQFSSCKEDAEFYKTVIPYEIKYIGTKGYSWHAYIDNIDKKLESLGLLGKNSHTKFIPDIYLFNDYETRLELLKGLMDGDGCAVHTGASVYITTSKRLSEDIMLLCRSLGITTNYNKGTKETIKALTNEKEYNCRESYRVAIHATIPIFKLPRKVKKQHIYRPDSKGSKATGFIYKTAIHKIEYVGKKKCKCVTVDSSDGLYLIGDYVVTHNCNKKGLYAYFTKMNSLKYLAQTPEYLRDREYIKYSAFGSNAFGVNASKPINDYANNLIREWLIKPTIIDLKDDEGNIAPAEVPQLYTLKSRALLDELINFTPEVNVDRIRAMGMLMIYREEKMILYGGDPRAGEEVTPDYLGNDEFFTQNYDNKFFKS